MAAQFSGTPAAGVDDVGAEQVTEAGAVEALDQCIPVGTECGGGGVAQSPCMSIPRRGSREGTCVRAAKSEIITHARPLA